MRKVINIAAVQTRVGDLSYSTLIVLCDDGAVLQYSPERSPPWTRFPSVPGPEVALEEVERVKPSVSLHEEIKLR